MRPIGKQQVLTKYMIFNNIYFITIKYKTMIFNLTSTNINNLPISKITVHKSTVYDTIHHHYVTFECVMTARHIFTQ